MKEKKKRKWDLKSFVIGKLRKSFRHTPMYSEARNRAKEEFYIVSKKGASLRRVRYLCAGCGRKFIDKVGARNIATDHVSPIVEVDKGFVDWNTWIERLFCDASNLQILCNYSGLQDGIKSCHKLKTAAEKKEAAKYRKDKKNG